MANDTPWRERLLELKERIELVRTRPPEHVGLWSKLRSPLYRLFGYEPNFCVDKLSALIDSVRLERSRRGMNELDALALTLEEDTPPFDQLFAAAVEELDANVRGAEIGAQLRGGFAAPQGVWLQNLAEVLLRLYPLVMGSQDSWELQLAETVSYLHIAPPLGGADPMAPLLGGTLGGKTAAIDAVIEAARNETSRLDRRRRLLEAARECLIEANAALRLDREAVSSRQQVIASELKEIARLGAAGLKAHVNLGHQLREAYQRSDWERLHAGLVGLEHFATESTDARAGAIAHRQLQMLWQGRDRSAAASGEQSAMRSATDIFGAATEQRLERGIEQAKKDYLEGHAPEKLQGLSPNDSGFAQRHVESLDTAVYLNGLLAVDGCFDVGGILMPTRVVEEHHQALPVRHPTARLALLAADSPADLPDAVIGDPRTLLADLATGKLLARRFLSNEPEKTERTALLSELRIYLLDGSTSMLTPRAVMRDSILIAELCTVIARLNDARRLVTPTLYFQYFEEKPGAVTEITTAEQAADAISTLLETVHTGGTDIQAALLSSLERIQSAQSRGMDLARANIVLITDGEAAVDEFEIVTRLDSLHGLTTGISIIALGEENPSLRSLAAHQKLMGRRVFYQYIDDVTIRRIIQGQQDAICLHPPSGVELQDYAEYLKETTARIVALDQEHNDEPGRDAYLEQALAEMDPDTALQDALRGRIELAQRNRGALTRRFERWFPRPLDGTDEALDDPAVYRPGDATEKKLDDIEAVLDAVCEVSALMSASPEELQADALEILQRTLADFGLSPFEYAKLISRFPARFRAALARVREATGTQ